MNAFFKPEALLLYICMFGVFIAQAQTEKTLTLDEITISSSRIKSTLKETFRQVEIVSSDELKQLPVQTLEEVLEYLPQVDIRQRGPLGVQADVSIGGGNFEQTLILINGVKVCDPQTAHHAMNIPVGFNNIERIEILKGAGSRIYGQNAFSGAINIITKTPEDAEMMIALTGGEHQFMSANLSASLPFKNIKQSFNANYRVSDGYIINTDFNILNLMYQAQLHNRWTFLASTLRKAFGANSFYTNLFPWQWEQTQTTFLNLGYNYSHIKSNAYYRRNTDAFLLKRDTPDFYRNYHYTDVLGVDFNYEFKSRIGQSAVGFEVRNEKINSTNLGDHQRWIGTLYFDHTYKKGLFSLDPGFSVSFLEGHKPAFFPGIDVGYQLSESINAFAGISRSYRLPSYTELFYTSPANIGDSNLKAEQAVHFEVGIRQVKGMIRWHITGFARNANNLIDWVRASDSDPWKVSNISHIRTYGSEFKFGYIPSKTNHVLALNRLSLSYTYLYADQFPTEYKTKNILDLLEHKAVLITAFEYFNRMQHSVSIRYEDRFSDDGHVFLDSKLSYPFQSGKVFIEASNILNVKYYEFSSILMPGRWIRGGFEYKIPLKK